MNFKKTFSYVILAFIFCLIGFGGGYLIGANSVPTKADDELAATNPPSLESYSSQPIENDDDKEFDECYLLKNENNTLTLYRITDEVTSVIKSIEINTSFLPSEDRIKLNKGIYFDDIEEGFSLIEDFTS
ncbi:MAG: BofC C-terminal domain-containing protein [Clostridia bacterium]|nr:BofC C-terminal domain-containing protein [Clostridia bacterium]